MLMNQVVQVQVVNHLPQKVQVQVVQLHFLYQIWIVGVVENIYQDQKHIDV